MRIPSHHRQHTLWALGYGALLLAWLSTEDATLWVVSILGAGLAVLLGWLALLRWWGGRRLRLTTWVIWGGVVGFSAVWCTVGLMIFKNAWHSHAYPDFATVIITAMIDRVLPWSLAGALLALAWGLWWATSDG